MSDMELIPLLCLLFSSFGVSSTQQNRPHDVVTVSEGEDALLPCALSSRQSIDKFDWRKDNGGEEKKEVFFYDRGSYYGNGLQGQNEQFKDRVVHTTGNASIVIKNTRLVDNGTYTCVLFEPSQQMFKIRLNVVGDLKIRNISGATQVPHVKQIGVESSWWILQCKVQGVPRPELEWRDSAGKLLLTSVSADGKHAIETEDGSGRFHVELRLQVTKSDNYTCVATQKDIYHQINNTLEVYLQVTPTKWIIAVGVLIGVVLLLLVGFISYCVWTAKKQKNAFQKVSANLEESGSLAKDEKVAALNRTQSQTSE